MGRGSPQPGRAGEPGPEPGEQGRRATFPGRLTVVIIPSTKRPLSSQTQTREKSLQGLGCRRRIRLGESTDCERPGSRVSSQTVSVAAARLCLRKRDRAAGRVEVNERDRFGKTAHTRGGPDRPARPNLPRQRPLVKRGTRDRPVSSEASASLGGLGLASSLL